ncbi:hypothetical protein SGLAM104S_08580 [Streptomyces glaucescens]
MAFVARNMARVTVSSWVMRSSRFWYVSLSGHQPMTGGWE